MKKTLLVLASFFLSIQLFAERVDKGTAMKVANTIVKEANLSEIATRNYNNLYIFSSENSFVIVSADDRVRPIIGYSDNNPFAVSEMTSNINYWLDKINNEIQYVIDNDIKATGEIQNEWLSLVNGKQLTPQNRAIVEALLTTKWNQDAPYNNMCPGGSVTGCGATAMAQVMKYWNWPITGKSAHGYHENDYGFLNVNFSKTMYDWHNMKDVYNNQSTETEKEAVATLMYHCGVAMEMDYSPEASGAYPSDISSALKKYFDYRSSLQDKQHYYYSDTEWENILKEELDAERPIVYNGWDSEGAGHSFVCDGYDEYNFFHFNWGWGGYSDGYFEIGMLNPGMGGIGSGSGVYSENNFITIGIEPNVTDDNTFALRAESDGYEPTVTLRWSAYHEAASFNIYRVVDSNEELLTNVPGDTFTYYDTNLAYDTEYCYIAKRVDESGNEVEISNESCVDLKANSCNPPSNITADIVENDPDFNMKFKVTISWEEVDNALKYILYADGKKYKELTETSVVIGTNKESTIVFTLQSICRNDYESDMSEPLSVEIKHVGIEEYENNIEIFPNPVNDKLFINGNLAIEEVSIYNITGVQVFSEQDINSNYINVTNLNKGVYILNIKTNDTNIVKRFVKE